MENSFKNYTKIHTEKYKRIVLFNFFFIILDVSSTKTVMFLHFRFFNKEAQDFFLNTNFHFKTLQF